MQEKRNESSLTGHRLRIERIAVLDNETNLKLISFGLNRCIIIWDLRSYSEITRIPTTLRTVQNITISPDGLYILTYSHDCNIKIWSFFSEKLQAELKGHKTS